MSGRRPQITREMYDELVGFYRRHPANYTGAAGLIGKSVPFAKKAWLSGWPQFEWAPPIGRVIEEEKLAGIAAAAQDMGLDQASPEIRAALAKQYNALIERETHKAIAHGASAVSSIMEGVEELGDAIKDALGDVTEALRMQGSIPYFTDDEIEQDGSKRHGWKSAEDKLNSWIERRLSLIQGVSFTFDKFASVLDKVMKSYQTKSGSPDKRIHHSHSIATDMTNDEIDHAFKMARKHSERLGLVAVAEEVEADSEEDGTVIDAEYEAKEEDEEQWTGSSE